jgi:cob(I)alamin adenosyltransferase
MVLQPIPHQERQGLIIVYTGDGKGKTTAALGIAVRAIGYNWRVLMVQFIKGDWKYGELEGYKKLKPNFTLKPMGKGFVKILGDKKPLKVHKEAAKKALGYIQENMDKNYDIVIMDEVHVAIKEGLIKVEDVLEVLKNKPSYLHIILTGRSAPKEIISAADLVTEMSEIKHPFKKGILAQAGIDY